VPRDIVVVTSRPPDATALVQAGLAVDPGLGVRAVEAGAYVQLVAGDGSAVVSFGHPSRVESADEIARLAPGAAERLGTPVFWTEAWAPWGTRGDVGVAVALGLAASLDGVCLVEDAS